MASRTNKKGIAQKKAQLERQAKRLKGAKRFDYPKRNLGIDMAKEISVIGAQTNPKGNTYYRFLKGRKICWETRMRMDPDGYRLVKLPSGGMDFREVMMSGRARKKLMKNTRKK